MLLRPSINVENITALADFISSGAHEWNYSKYSMCFIGQSLKLWGEPRNGSSIAQLREKLGIDNTTVMDLCINLCGGGLWSAHRFVTRERAVSILHYLAATGLLPPDALEPPRT